MKTIFVVDDNDTNLAMAEDALEDHFNVMTLPSAEKMFSLFEKIIPDLILLDIEMPVMNGFEALERLKSDKSWSGIPVLFLTGTSNASIEEKGKTLGVAGVIIKPFTPSLLLERINSII